ncbi:MAG TPA: hypothetical protein VFP27_15835 [Mycobacterium sp.]|nr:hypothetical protein [Mycobacterium sp.]
MCCRLVGGSRSPVVAEFAEGAGELAAQPLVLVGEFAVAAVGDFEATSQGVVAGALLGGYRCARLGSALVAESADLVGEVGLGVAARLLRTAGSHQQRWPGPRPELDIADAVGARGRAGVAATVAVLLSPSRASAKLVLPVTVAAPVVGRTPGRCRPRTQPSAPSRAA